MVTKYVSTILACKDTVFKKKKKKKISQIKDSNDHLQEGKEICRPL